MDISKALDELRDELDRRDALSDSDLLALYALSDSLMGYAQRMDREGEVRELAPLFLKASDLYGAASSKMKQAHSNVNDLAAAYQLCARLPGISERVNRHELTYQDAADLIMMKRSMMNLEGLDWAYAKSHDLLTPYRELTAGAGANLVTAAILVVLRDWNAPEPRTKRYLTKYVRQLLDRESSAHELPWALQDLQRAHLVTRRWGRYELTEAGSIAALLRERALRTLTSHAPD
jgi:hypothetical protein